MTSSLVQIRELLLKSIDKDAKVVDAGGVKKAISALEKMTITKEALEGTRLGRLVNNIRRASTDDKLNKRCRRLIQKWQDQFVGSIKSKPADGGIPTTSQLNQKSASKSSPKAGSLVCQTPVTTGGTPVDQTKSENRKRRKPESATSSPEDKRPPKKQQIVDSPKQRTTELSTKDGIKQREDTITDQKDRSPSQKVIVERPGRTRSSRDRSNDSNKETKSLHKQVVVSNATKAVGIVNKTQSQSRAKVIKSKKSPKGAKLGSSQSKRNGSTTSASSPSQSLCYEETNQASISLSDKVVPASPESFHNDENTQGSNNESEAVSMFDTEGEEKEKEGSIDELTMSSVADSPVDSQDSGSSQHSHQSHKLSETVIDARIADGKPVEEVCLPKREVTEEDVNRLHHEHCEGMNGNYNSNGEWSSWDSCLVLDTGQGNSLHILPYVSID